MNCLKCGREIPQGQAFCPDCLSAMEKYPVKPGAPVHLPVRPVNSATRRQTRQRWAISEKEQIRRQKKAIRRLSVVLALVVLVFGMYIAASVVWFRRQKQPPIGQNYTSSAVTTNSTAGTTGK